MSNKRLQHSATGSMSHSNRNLHFFRLQRIKTQCKLWSACIKQAKMVVANRNGLSGRGSEHIVRETQNFWSLWSVDAKGGVPAFDFSHCMDMMTTLINWDQEVDALLETKVTSKGAAAAADASSGRPIGRDATKQQRQEAQEKTVGAPVKAKGESFMDVATGLKSQQLFCQQGALLLQALQVDTSRFNDDDKTFLMSLKHGLHQRMMPATTAVAVQSDSAPVVRR